VYQTRVFSDTWDRNYKKMGRESKCSLSKEYIKMQKEVEKLDTKKQKPLPRVNRALGKRQINLSDRI
jgi:hypothetical protein